MAIELWGKMDVIFYLGSEFSLSPSQVNSRFIPREVDGQADRVDFPEPFAIHEMKSDTHYFWIPEQIKWWAATKRSSVVR